MRQAVVRDIREDLFERMEAATAEMASARTNYDHERRELEQRYHMLFEEIGNRQRAIATLLDGEMKVHGSASHRMSTVNNFKAPLQEYLMNLLSASGPLSKDDIKDLATRAGYADGNDRIGRTIHFTLMNLARAGKLRINKSDQYEVTNTIPLPTVSKSLLDTWAQAAGTLSNEEGEPTSDVL